MESKPKQAYRPPISRDLEQAARLAGARIGLSPRDYIVLALRDALRKVDKLPAGWEMSSEEVFAIGGSS